MSSSCQCPRCGSHSLERLKTYSHCSQCLYFEDEYSDSESQYAEARRIEREVIKEAPASEEEELAEAS